MLGLVEVRLDLVALSRSSNSLFELSVPQAHGKLGVRRVLITGTNPEEVGDDGDDTIPVNDQKQVDQVQGLRDGQIVQHVGSVGLNLIKGTSNGGRDVQVQGRGHLGDDFDNLESSGHHEGREHDWINKKQGVQKGYQSHE